MKDRLFLLILCCFSMASLHAQSDCEMRLQEARKYKAKKDYRQAVKQYEKVLEYCSYYIDEKKVKDELKECREKISDMNAVFQLGQIKLECGGEGGSLVMELKKAPANWSVMQCPEWMQVTETLKEEMRVWFYVSPNPRAERRKGIIILRSDKGKTQDFTVVQGKGEENIAVRTDHLSFGNGGGNQSIVVDCNFNWGFGTSDSWIQLSKRGDDKLLVSCAYNAYPKERKATITVFGEEASQNIEVFQFAGDTYFSVSGTTDSTVLFKASGGENSKLRVSCNDEWNIKNNCSWIDVARSYDAIVITSQPNPWAERRTGSFQVVTSVENLTKTILVEQDGAKPSLNKISLPSKSGERPVNSVRPHYRSLNIKGNGGDLVAKVHSNIQNWHYYISPEDVSWIIEGGTVPRDSLLKLRLYDNNGWMWREADVIISAMGIRS